jgi:cysteine synthase B
MQAKELIQADDKLKLEVKKLSAQIGNTPIHHIGQLFQKKGVKIFAKKEWMQLSGSVKARAAYSIIRSAIFSGELNRNKILLDATSGNTGIAYATIAKILGIPVTLCLPENASPQRKEILLSSGAEIIYTSKFEGTDGAQQVAKELSEKYPEKYFYADQYKNDNNWKAHYHHTAIEIYESFPRITHFVAGLGTTGTFTGTGRKLKELNPAIQLISLQPDRPLHGLEGWKHLETAVVPKFYDASLADQNYEIDTIQAYEIIKAAKEYEGLLLSPSSAANLAGAIKVAEGIDEGIIVSVLPDNGDKYGEIINRII